jgi:hypothetical protein
MVAAKRESGVPGTALGVASVRQDPKCSRSRRVFEACSRYPRIVSDPGLATPNEGLIRVRVHTEITPLQCAAIWTPGGHRWRSRKHLWPAAGISVRRRDLCFDTSQRIGSAYVEPARSAACRPLLRYALANDAVRQPRPRRGAIGPRAVKLPLSLPGQFCWPLRRCRCSQPATISRT